MKSLILVCFICVSACTGFLTGKKPFPPWNKLSVTWKKFNGLPMTEVDAISDGWVMDKDACKDATFFQGKRYVLNNDISTMLLFDTNGKIAGRQLAEKGTSQDVDVKNQVSNTVEKFNKNQIGGPIHDDGTHYVMTAYFTEPNAICSGKARAKDLVGDKLFFLLDGKGTLMEIPLKEAEIGKTKWTKGKCFWTMGQHYWYNLYNDKPCDDLFPFFLLYNGGVLNGFGFATQFEMTTSRIEHPPQKRLWLFMDPKTLPKCLPVVKYLSTQHVFLERRPYLNHC